MKKVQTLTEEIQKMRKLMSFNINENSHDSLSEENFIDSIGGSNIDPEQKECAQTYSGPSEIVKKMTNILNNMLEAKLEEIQKQVKVKIVATGPTNVRVEMGDISLPLTQDIRSRSLFTFEESINIPFASDLSLSLFKEELLNSDKCFRMVYDRYNSVKNQIDGDFIEMELTPAVGYENMVGNLMIKMILYSDVKQLKKQFKKGLSKLVDINNVNLFDFVKSGFFVDLDGGFYGEMSAAFGVKLVEMKLFGADVPSDWGEPEGKPSKCVCNDIETGVPIEYPCDGELPERCKRKRKPIVFDFYVDAAQNYNFDDAALTDLAKKEIDKEINTKWNDIEQKYKDGYIQFLTDKDIYVNSYSSIDALSNFPDGGRYAGCSSYGIGKGPRKKYNQCLSQARAQSVVDYLKSDSVANGAFKDVNFVAVGKGETNQFSGLKWDNEETPKIVNGVPVNVKSPYGTDKTRPDRRFEVKFPEWHTED